MDGRSSQQGLDRIMTSKKGNSVASKSSVSERDRNSQYCNRIGCNGRIKYGQNKRIGNEVTGNTSSSNSSSGSLITSSKKPYVDGKRNFTSQPKHDSSESSLSVYSAASELVSAPNSSSSGYHSKLKKTSDKTIVAEAGSSSGSLNIKPLKDFDRKLKLPNCKASASSSFSDKGSTVRPVNGRSGNKCGLRNMTCNSTSDVVPPSTSSSDTKSAAKNVMRKRSQEGGKNSFSHRGERKKSLVSTSVAKGNARSSDSGILISDSRQSSSASGEDSNRHANSRAGRIGKNNNVLDNEIPFRVGGRSSSRPFSSNLTLTGSRSRGLLSADGDRALQRTPFASSFEPVYSHLISHDVLCRYNMNDIDAVLFALELLEQDVELTHEQVRLLESSSLLNGLNLYDQHRDMRLDIDNMSYEELLALGERMGTVSTALSEEEMSKCLEKGIYQQTPLDVQVTGDDSKCSICQEEYEVGDEIGTLVECKHEYHASCITQWFREQQGIDGEIPDEVNAVNEKNGLSSDLMPNEKIVKRTETKEIIEKLILQETFTREECNWIMELLNSRVVDSSKRSAENNLLAESPEKNQEDVEIYNKVTQEAKKWFKDKKVGSISMTELASGTSKVDSGGASPVDVARSYMKERPCWQSPTRNDDVITPFSAKLFKEGASYSVGYDSLSSSKKRSSLASGSWNIQEELQRVRAKATEEMLRTPFKKLDPLILASTASGEGIIGAGKPVSGARKVDAWVNAGVSSDPVLAALESRQYGRTSEGQSFHMAAAVSKTIQDSDVVYADDDKFHFKNPSVPNHDEEKHADPNSSGINGTTETEVTAELMGRQDLANGVSSSQPSLSAGIESKQNDEQCNEENHITRPLTEKDSVINTTTHSLANTNETYTEVPIVTETGSLASGSQNNLGLESEELLSVDMTAPSTKGEVAGKQQRKKPGNKPSRRGRGRGLVKG